MSSFNAAAEQERGENRAGVNGAESEFLWPVTEEGSDQSTRLVSRPALAGVDGDEINHAEANTGKTVVTVDAVLRSAEVSGTESLPIHYRELVSHPAKTVRQHVNGFIPSPKQLREKAWIKFEAIRRWMSTPNGFALFVKCVNLIIWGSLLVCLFNTFTAMPGDVNRPWWAAKKTDSRVPPTISCFVTFGHSWFIVRYRLWKHSDPVGSLRCTLVSDEFPLSVDECTKPNQQGPTIPLPVSKTPPPPPERTLATDKWSPDNVTVYIARNTLLQACVVGLLLYLDPDNRPSNAKDFCLSLAASVAVVDISIAYLSDLLDAMD